MRRLAPALVLLALALAGALLAALAHDAPLAPGLARGWLRADALSALALILLGAHGLVAWASEGRARWPMVAAACLFGAAAVIGHLALVGGLLLLGGVALVLPSSTDHGPRTTDHRRSPARQSSLVRRLSSQLAQAGWMAQLAALLATCLGLVVVGIAGGEWLYGAPGGGAGRNSLSFALLLAGALAASGAHSLALGRAPAGSPLAAVACLYALLRLFSLGPWNLGWLFAALVAGGAVALGAAWQAAAPPPEQTAAWLGLYLCGLAVAGAGLGSGAGVTLAGYALLTWPVMRLGLARLDGPRWPLWLLTGAAPLTAPFMLAWMAVAAAVAGGLTLLAAALWGAALLAAAAVGRRAARSVPTSPPDPPSAAERGSRAERGGGEVFGGTPVFVAAGLSVALGLGAPLVVLGLLGPLVAQVQGGLTPFGEIALWPWAGLIALNAARQPVATMPSLALAALMLILAALCWVALRLAGLRWR